MRPRALPLLFGQTTALGLMLAFLIVPASAIFLHTYGAARLPYAYLAVAASGVLVSTAMRRLQGRLSLAGLAVAVHATILALVAASWLVLRAGDGAWVTFVLVVLFPLSIPVGFVLIGGQAGRLLDVRQMKAHFPKVVAGFSAGFGVGGLLAAGLVHPLGGPVDLLAIDALAVAGMLWLVLATARRYPGQLRARPEPAPAARQDNGRLGELFATPLIALVFGYQVLSAMVTQLLDYMVWERAAARFPDPADLARFQGVFGAVINVVGLVFVMLLAGRLLTRFGVGLGLAANPAGVIVVLVVATVTGYSAGLGSVLLLGTVCAAQVVDIALTDGMTRTGINATYQALPRDGRLRAQTGVEAAGIPLALGLVGLLLLGFRWAALDVRAVGVLTLVLCVVWLVLAQRAWREYGQQLRAEVAGRPWDPLPAGARAAVVLVEPVPGEAPPGPALTELLAEAARRDAPAGLEVRLCAHADELLPALRDMLGNGTGEQVVRDRLLRAVAEAGTEPGVALLRGSIGHRDRRTAAAAVRALVAADRTLPPDQVRPGVEREVRRAAACLAALEAVRGGSRIDAGAANLQRALSAEVVDGAVMLTSLLALCHGHGISRTVAALGLAEDGLRGRALETLEVSAGAGIVRLALPLVDPTLADDQRLGALPDEVLVERRDAAGWLAELVADPAGVWQEPWLRVCALHAAPALLGEEAVAFAVPWLDDPHPQVAETAALVATGSAQNSRWDGSSIPRSAS